jgi:hypothetical protein
VIFLKRAKNPATAGDKERGRAVSPGAAVGCVGEAIR